MTPRRWVVVGIGALAVLLGAVRWLLPYHEVRTELPADGRAVVQREITCMAPVAVARRAGGDPPLAVDRSGYPTAWPDDPRVLCAGSVWHRAADGGTLVVVGVGLVLGALLLRRPDRDVGGEPARTSRLVLAGGALAVVVGAWFAFAPYRATTWRPDPAAAGPRASAASVVPVITVERSCQAPVQNLRQLLDGEGLPSQHLLPADDATPGWCDQGGTRLVAGNTLATAGWLAIVLAVVAPRFLWGQTTRQA